MNDGVGVEQTLISRKATFHKICRLQFNTTNMKRASKRTTTVSDDNASCDAHGRFTRQKMFRSDHVDGATDKCFFYDKPATRGNHLHEASTFDVDTRVRQCACNLQYESLMAKLSEGDFISIEAKYHG